MAALGIIGTLVGVAGTIMQGNYQAAALKSQSQAAKARAQEERAASQREAIRRSKEAKQVMSRQLALSAASGGGAGDPGIVNLMAETGREGVYQSRVAVAEGETKGRGLEYQAAIYRMQARQARLASFINAGSSLISGVSSWAKYQPSATLPTYQPQYHYYATT